MGILTGYIFILGLFIGSFLLVVIDRLPAKKSFLTDRSECDSCKHVLSWYDLIPVVSFLLVGGRCRYCHTRLSYNYPLLEVITGMLFVLSYLLLPHSTPIQVAYYLFIMSILILIFFIDLKNGIIPFSIILPGILFAVLWNIFGQPQVNPLPFFISAISSGLFFLMLFLGTKGRGMGFGDVVFSFFMGMVLGFPGIIVALYVAFLTGAAFSLILLMERKKKLKSAIPFGPFLVLGTIVTLFWGRWLTDLFVNTFLL